MTDTANTTDENADGGDDTSHVVVRRDTEERAVADFADKAVCSYRPCVCAQNVRNDVLVRAVSTGPMRAGGFVQFSVRNLGPTLPGTCPHARADSSPGSERSRLSAVRAVVESTAFPNASPALRTARANVVGGVVEPLFWDVRFEQPGTHPVRIAFYDDSRGSSYSYLSGADIDALVDVLPARHPLSPWRWLDEQMVQRQDRATHRLSTALFGESGADRKWRAESEIAAASELRPGVLDAVLRVWTTYEWLEMRPQLTGREGREPETEYRLTALGYAFFAPGFVPRTKRGSAEA